VTHVQRKPAVSPRIHAYLEDIVATCAPPNGPLVSLVLFGSGATGGYADGISDVDLFLILADDTMPHDHERTREMVEALEMRHGLAKRESGATGRLEAFAQQVTANRRAFFVCTRSDLLSGLPGRVLGIPRAQAVFVDAVAVPSIVGSGVTVWGEDLLPRVTLAPIRRIDTAKAFFSLFSQVLFCAAVYPLLPTATKYAMDALKRSVHNCYFCYHLRPAALAEEVAFMERRYGRNRTLTRLLQLRVEYRPSLGFVLSCLPTLAVLHARTASDAGFPLEVRADIPANRPAARSQ
jgi:hypothetical protein